MTANPAVLRARAEQQFADELIALKQHDSYTKPPQWQLSPQAVVTYLMGGTREQISFAIKNMIGNITGMICDGAKPSCTLKVSNGVSTAILSAFLAIDNKVVSSAEGITDEGVDKTIHNLTKIGRDGMNETDRMVLDIMMNK